MKIFLSLVSILIFSFSTLNADEVKIITYDFPPYSYNTEREQSGYGTEIIKSILNGLNLRKPIKEYPTKRAILMGQKFKNILIYPIVRDKETEHKYYWIGKISNGETYFFKYKKKKNLTVNSLREAKKYTIGLVRGTDSTGTLSAEGFQKIEYVTTAIQNIKKLMINRVDLIVSDKLALAHSIEKLNKKTNQNIAFKDFEKVIPLKNRDNIKGIYIALSKNTPLKTVKKYQTAFQKLEKEGTILEVAHWWTNDIEKKMLSFYRSELKKQGYKWVDYTVKGGGGSKIMEVLKTRVKIQNWPHAIHTYMGPKVWDWASKDMLVDLTELAKSENWKRNLPALVNKNIQYKGNYVAVPANVQRVNWMWVNPVVFKKSGAKIPANWPEFFEAIEKIKAAGFIPISIGKEPWQEGTLFEDLVLGIGGINFYKKALVELDPNALASPMMFKILDTMRKLKNYTKRSPSTRTWVKAAEQVAKGKAAIYFMGDWAKGVFKSLGLPYGNKGYLCVPVPGTKDTLLNNTDVFVFLKVKKSNLPAQTALARIIMKAKAQEKFNLYKGSVPARLNIPKEKFDECSQISMDLVSEKSMVPSFNYIQTQPEEIHTKMVNLVSQYFNSEMATKIAIQKMVKIAVTN